MRGTARNKNSAPKTAVKTIKGMGITGIFRLDKTFTIFTRFGVKTRDNPDSKDSLEGSVLASVHPRKFRCHDEIRPISGISVLAPRDNAGLSIRRQLALYFPDQSNP